MAKLKQVSAGRYQTGDGAWSVVLVEDPELKQRAHYLPTDSLWSLHSAVFDIAELHPSRNACRARIAAVERERRHANQIPSQASVTQYRS